MQALQPVLPITRLRANVAPASTGRQYTVRCAQNEQTRTHAYQLRYRCYLEGGHISPNATGLFADRFDALPTAHTAVVYDEAGPVASVRVCFLSRDQLAAAPAGCAFPDQVGALLAKLPDRHAHPQAAEITRLVRSPRAENNQGLVFLLLRIAGHIALQEDVPLLMSCVRQNHVPFYKRIGCEVAGDLRPYPGLSCAMQLLACPRPRYDAARASFPIIDPEAGQPEDFDGLLEGAAITLPLIPAIS